MISLFGHVECTVIIIEVKRYVLLGQLKVLLHRINVRMVHCRVQVVSMNNRDLAFFVVFILIRTRLYSKSKLGHFVAASARSAVEKIERFLTRGRILWVKRDTPHVYIYYQPAAPASQPAITSSYFLIYT